MQNLITCCELAGVTVKDIILEQLASAAGVLSTDEQILGVGMLDIGGGTSDFAIYFLHIIVATGNCNFLWLIINANELSAAAVE